MQTAIPAAELSDDEILAHLDAIRVEGNRLLARLLELLVLVEERRIHMRSAYPSIFEFCCERLQMSNAAASRRAAAVRLVRRFPPLVGNVERGELSLSTLCLLRDHLTAENFDELVGLAVGKSVREVEKLLVRRAPKPDVPATITVIAAPIALPLGAEPPAPTRASPPARIAPLSPATYELRLTASAELKDKLERARDLLRHRNPSGDLAVVVERAVDALLVQLEKERLGATARPQKKARGTKKGRVSRATRREVFERDGMQCTYVDAAGHRCGETGWLEVDHIVPRALGGSDEAWNLRVRCRSHNRLHAEECFGKEHVDERVRFRRRKWNQEAAELARRGLVNLGFRDADVRRALATIESRHEGEDTTPPPAEIIREALRILT
jgi:5-methylcytosine-specific restriction endonuclease McrA